MRLIYVSNSAADRAGRPHAFLQQEREWLLRRFGQATVVSFYGVSELRTDGLDRPRGPVSARLRALCAAPFSRDLRAGVAKLRGDGKLNAVNLLKLFAFVKRGLKLHYWIEGLFRQSDEPTTLYAFWMSYDAYAAALSKRKHPNVRFVARGHAYDVDPERNPMNPYLLKEAILDACDGAYLISRSARDQLTASLRGPVDESKLHVLAMGSGGAPVAATEPPCLSSGVLNVVSCSRVTEIKRLPLIVEALSGWAGMPMRWTHIGDGEGLEALRALAEEKLDRKENVIWSLAGGMSNQDARTYYERNACDALLNASSREASPVSIMEAMRCGVPAIAPDVGGVPEMLEGGAGVLYDPADGAAGLRAALARFASQPPDDMRAMRRAAKERWDERYQSDRLLAELFPPACAKEDEP